MIKKEQTQEQAETGNATLGVVMWRCLEDFVMENGDKETAFIKGKTYKQVGTFENGIELINEQGYAHKIYGHCMRFFNAT